MCVYLIIAASYSLSDPFRVWEEDGGHYYTNFSRVNHRNFFTFFFFLSICPEPKNKVRAQYTIIIYTHLFFFRLTKTTTAVTFQLILK